MSDQPSCLTVAHDSGGPTAHFEYLAYCDGSCDQTISKVMGVGAIVINVQSLERIERMLPIAKVGTNNLAELYAIKASLATVPKDYRPKTSIIIHTDSEYAIGVLSGVKRAKDNLAAVAMVQRMILQFRMVTFMKVKGHSGHKGNHRADILAGNAMRSAKTLLHSKQDQNAILS